MARTRHHARTDTDVRALLSESIGTALLLAAIVGSGITASAGSPADEGLQLLGAALATGLALGAIIAAFGPISGAHLNPAVSLADQLLHRRGWARTGGYIAAQLAGAVLGVLVANLMFGLPAISVSATGRGGVGLWLGELVATFGLVAVIFLMVRAKASANAIGAAVGAYIAGAHFFTSSTSFANPAVTLARTLSDTYAGIAPADTLPFVLAQFLGGLLAVVTVRALSDS